MNSYNPKITAVVYSYNPEITAVITKQQLSVYSYNPKITAIVYSYNPEITAVVFGYHATEQLSVYSCHNKTAAVCV